MKFVYLSNSIDGMFEFRCINNNKIIDEDDLSKLNLTPRQIGKALRSRAGTNIILNSSRFSCSWLKKITDEEERLLKLYFELKGEEDRIKEELKRQKFNLLEPIWNKLKPIVNKLNNLNYKVL